MRFSVIIPVYNGEETIGKCLNSIFSQEYDDYEVLCINDGSTDGTANILDEYKHYDNFRIISKTNGGIASARNTGLDNAEGEYLFFVDSDDWVEEGVFSIIDEIINSNASELIFFNFYRTIRGKNIPKKILLGENGEIKEKDTIDAFANYFKTPVLWNKVIKREVLVNNDIRFHDFYYLDDLVFCIEIYQKVNEVMFLNTYGYHYVENESSITHKHESRIIDMWKYYYEHAITLSPISIQDEYIKYMNASIFEGLIQIYYRYIDFCYSRVREKKKAFLTLLNSYPYCEAIKNYNRKYLSKMAKIMFIFGKPMYSTLLLAGVVKRIKKRIDMI